MGMGIPSAAAVFLRQKYEILHGVRLAGGYKAWFLQPHKSLLVLLALCHRGRAVPKFSALMGVARLFGFAPAPTPGARRRLLGPPIPDPVVFKVFEFWLGDAKPL